MTTPLATIFHGDVTLEQGSDITQFGWGDLTANRRCIINGTEDSISNTDGSLIVAGGVGISKNANIHGNLNVLYGITQLTETHIDTTNGPFTVTGGNTVNIQVGAASKFVSTGGNLNLTSSINSLQLYGGLNSLKAIDICATNVAGGISLLSGTNTGNISIVSGSGGIIETTSNGSIILTANNGGGNFNVNSLQNNQNLLLNLSGLTDSQLQISSSGINALNTALVINTTNTNGCIKISNADGLGNGSISQLAGSGGFSIITNTSGPISLTSQGAESSFTVNTNNSNQHMTLSLNGDSDSSLIIKSNGNNYTNDAIQIYTLHTAGNISIIQPSLSKGKINILTGSGGFITTTQTSGSIIMNCYGATSTYTNTSMTDDQDLNITVTGNTKSKVNITSSGTNYDAIKLSTTNGGGIYVTSNSKVQIESSDLINGIQIATVTSNTPVYIGTSNSTTTIYGNLDVKGITTSVESTVVTISDNIMVVNNAPSGTSDGGLAIKRFQSANNTNYGDVINDIPDVTGYILNGDNTKTTVHLDLNANIIENYYAGWWIVITGGTGINQVRRIKSYDGTNRIATLYSSSDQTGILNNPIPVEGMDFLTIPDTTSSYALYPCEYVMMIWDESHDEFALVCSNQSPSNNTSIVHYSDLHINNLVSNNINTTTINGLVADTSFYVTLNNNSTVPVSMINFPFNYGIYMVFVKPQDDTTRSHGIFMIGRVNVSNMSGTVVRIISVKGIYNDQLDIQWPANSFPQLLYRPFPNGINGSTKYRVKIVSI